jgi:biopolymer transport protein ExbB/TolQ
MWGQLALSLQSANGYVIAIMVLGFIAFVLMIERLIMLQFVYNIDFPKFLMNLKKMVHAEDHDRAITLCKNVSSTSLPKISLRALEAAETDPSRIRGTIEEEAIGFIPNIERRLGALPAISMIIMLVGILGTIDALFGAFQSIDVLDSARKQSSLAQGIAASLNPTAMGLLFGMVLMAGFYFLKGIAATLTDRMHHGVAVVTNLLAPQEMATFMPMEAGPISHASSESSVNEPVQQMAAETPTQPEESFDDVSVDDIKDEEEII